MTFLINAPTSLLFRIKKQTLWKPRYANKLEGGCGNDIIAVCFLLQTVWHVKWTVHSLTKVNKRLPLCVTTKLSSCTIRINFFYHRHLVNSLATNSPDSLPPAICRISFVKPGAPNWHDKSWSVRGSFLSISRSKKNSSVKLRTCSYSIDSMLMLIGLQSFSLSLRFIFLCRSLLLAFTFVWASEEEEEHESPAEDDISPQEAVSRCNYRSQQKWLQLKTVRIN